MKNTHTTQLTKAIKNIKYDIPNGDVMLSRIFNERHLSDFLAWCLDKRSSHGWNSSFMKAFVGLIAERRSDNALHYHRSPCTIKKGSNGNGRQYSTLRLSNAAVVTELHFAKGKKTETNFIDLAILDFDKKDDYIITIENKLFGQNTKKQLSNYRSQVENQYKHAIMREYVYLTFDGRPPKGMTVKEQAYWITLSWTEDILPLLIKLAKKTSSQAVTDVIDALNWAKGLRTSSPFNFRKEYLNVISDIVLYDLNRYLNNSRKVWDRKVINKKDITFKHPSTPKSELCLTIESDLDIAFVGRSKNGNMFTRYIIPFGIPVNQLINMIEYFVRLMYEDKAKKSWAKYYINRHRNKSEYLSKHSSNRTFLTAIQKQRQEIKIINGMMN